tara:strand:- start:369 stop:593 length:225 start_codon:yes stop_codon:yes gene_type:complete
LETKELQYNKKNFEFCSKKVKTFKENLTCQQDSLHKSMVDNPLGFILFYVFAIVFIALLFQLSRKDFNSKGKKK